MVVLAFDNVDDAHKVRNKLVELNNQFLLRLDQAVEVVRTPDNQVKIKEERSLAGAGAIGGAFWGLLLGLVFLLPGVGMVVGATTGAIAGHFAKYGITKEYMNQINEAIKPGQSALFILAEDMKMDRVVPQLSQFHPRVLKTSLSMDQEKALREAFGSQVLVTA